MNLTRLLRMARWARRPPSERRVVLVAITVALCLALAGAEWLGLFPEDWGIDPRQRSLRP